MIILIIMSKKNKTDNFHEKKGIEISLFHSPSATIFTILCFQNPKIKPIKNITFPLTKK